MNVYVWDSEGLWIILVLLQVCNYNIPTRVGKQSENAY